MNRVKSDGMIPDPVPFVPVPLTDEHRTLGNNPVLESHNKFVGELVKDAIHVGRFVPVVGSVIVIVEGTVAAGKHGVYMIGLVADGDFSGAANAHTAYMTSSLVSFAGNDWLADLTGLDKLLNILDEKGNQNGRLAGAAGKEILMVLLPAALAKPANAGNAPNRLIGAGEQTVGRRIPLNNVPVTRQPTANTCVPASVDMLLEELAPGRAATSIENLRLAPRGMHPTDAALFVNENLEAVGMRMVRGDMPQALANGRPFIAIVDEGHAVVVQGVREVHGVRHVVVRDPLGAYLEPLVDFDARLVRDTSVVAHPTIWGVPNR